MKKTVEKIKTLLRNVKQKDKERVNNSDVIKADNLVPFREKRVAMDHLTIRPNLTGKKTVGLLEAYSNGLRFTSHQGQTVDLNYANVKHAFFQPCMDELIVLLHFHLHQPYNVNQKKTTDI